MARMLFVSFARYHRHTFPAVMHILCLFYPYSSVPSLKATSILRVYTTQEEKKHIDA